MSCHCGSKETVNVTETLCNTHFNEFKERLRIERVERDKRRPVVNPDDVETYFACPYCGDGLSEEWSACCGEAGHGEDHYIYLDEQYSETEFFEKFQFPSKKD